MGEYHEATHFQRTTTHARIDIGGILHKKNILLSSSPTMIAAIKRTTTTTTTTTTAATTAAAAMAMATATMMVVMIFMPMTIKMVMMMIMMTMIAAMTCPQIYLFHVAVLNSKQNRYGLCAFWTSCWMLQVKVCMANASNDSR